MLDWAVQSWQVLRAHVSLRAQCQCYHLCDDLLPLPLHSHISQRTDTGHAILHFFPGIDDIIRLDQSAYIKAPASAASLAFWQLASEQGLLLSASRALVVHNKSHYITRTSFVAVEFGPLVAPLPHVLFVRTTMARPLSAFPLATTVKELGGTIISHTPPLMFFNINEVPYPPSYMRQLSLDDLVQITLDSRNPAVGAVLYSTAFPVPDFTGAHL